MDSLLTAMSLALADVSTDLRARYPQLYERVDAILADPDRDQGEQQFKNAAPFDDEWELAHRRECGWCGEWFWVESTSRPEMTCSNSCGQFYMGWLRRRKRADAA